MSLLPLNHVDDYTRYGRQMILPEIGLPGQIALQNASVAVVGAGGLGCPVIQYLACAGVATIGIFDGDIVELSNLQRQVLHNGNRLGMNKALSAAEAVKELNPRVNTRVFSEHLTSSNASTSLAAFDVILDCTDNAPTRYLLSDTAVRLGKPLVSGAAQKLEGQLCVYNLAPAGPCYRCLFPTPPPREAAASCAETGILGVVTGIIGNMQALETIKLLTGLHDKRPNLLLFSALGSPQFRSIKLRARSPNCLACGENGSRAGEISQTDYVAFCGGPAPDWEKEGLVAGGAGARITAKELSRVLATNPQTTVIDVRSPTEFGICHLPQSTNRPLADIIKEPISGEDNNSNRSPIYVVCRLGNDSQIAAERLRVAYPNMPVMDLVGGLRSWSKDVDPEFPVY